MVNVACAFSKNGGVKNKHSSVEYAVQIRRNKVYMVQCMYALSIGSVVFFFHVHVRVSMWLFTESLFGLWTFVWNVAEFTYVNNNTESPLRHIVSNNNSKKSPNSISYAWTCVDILMCATKTIEREIARNSNEEKKVQKLKRTQKYIKNTLSSPVSTTLTATKSNQ